MLNNSTRDEEVLFLAVIQAQDIDQAEDALDQINITTTRLSSLGGFLGRRNATLLIGLPVHKKEEVIQALKQTCRQRVEYIAVPLESAPLPLPAPTPITIGGANIFSIDVEYFEEV